MKDNFIKLVNFLQLWVQKNARQRKSVLFCCVKNLNIKNMRIKSIFQTIFSLPGDHQYCRCYCQAGPSPFPLCLFSVDYTNTYDIFFWFVRSIHKCMSQKIIFFALDPTSSLNAIVWFAKNIVVKRRFVNIKIGSFL